MTEPAKPLEPITLNPRTWLEPGVERRNVCICGAMYTQEKIAFRFVESLAKGRGEKAANDFVKQIPDGWIPVYCPKCESQELGRLAERRQFGAPPIPISRRDYAIKEGGE